MTLLDTFDAVYDKFSELHRLWPSAPSLRMAGEKTILLEALAKVAVQHGMPRPWWKLLPKSELGDNFGFPDDPDEKMGIDDEEAEEPTCAVVKRSYSGYGDHVYLPDQKGRIDLDAIRFGIQRDGDTKSWILQEWVPTLLWFGEYNIYFVSKKPVCVTHSRFHQGRQVWEYTPVLSVYTLEELR